ncbi:unnamed protein product [Didymodactylos carnosus]|uniref:Uncharacterized protein n=1 Tax=Didymodactylos carnosus TaxID=1234261 RepID=A0A814HD84_9BILA|nr:unnamed protein product [Didymodactylos carnosus]CAF3778725.1 unnamed protein product [Didymodactylos carnosus]
MKMNCNELYEIEYESNQKNAEEVDDDVVGEKTKKVQRQKGIKTQITDEEDSVDLYFISRQLTTAKSDAMSKLVGSSITNDSLSQFFDDQSHPEITAVATANISDSHSQTVILDPNEKTELSKQISELKKMIAKNEYPPPLAESMIVKKINLMTLDGKTPTRFMLNVARVMLESDQFTNGYLPDFKGEKLSRIPIDED